MRTTKKQLRKNIKKETGPKSDGKISAEKKMVQIIYASLNMGTRSFHLTFIVFFFIFSFFQQQQQQQK